MKKTLLVAALALTMAMAFALPEKMDVSASVFAGFNIVDFDAGAEVEMGLKVSEGFTFTAGVDARITKSIFTDPDASPSPSVGPFIGFRAKKFALSAGVLSNWNISSTKPAYQNWIPYLHLGLLFPIRTSETGENRLKFRAGLDWYMNAAGENLEAKTFEAIWNIIVPKVEVGLTYGF